MTMIVELTFEQIADAVRRLPPADRAQLFRLFILESEPEGPTSSSSMQPGENALPHRERGELDQQLATAADILLEEYLNNKELTAFSALDGEVVHEEI